MTARAMMTFALVLALSAVAAPIRAGVGTAECTPTRADALGPFYVPGAPVRSKVGTGHVLTGFVRSAATCRPLAGAKVELWNAGPVGDYGPRWRATTFSRADGSYRYQSNLPPAYGGRPPHIHLRVSVRAHRTLVTQYYPKPGSTRGRFDLVLRRA